MKKTTDSLDALRDALRHFAAAREWEQFHTPKNLAMALSVEVAELVEHFQWLTAEQSVRLDAKTKQAVGEEIADVVLYLTRLADILGIEPITAAQRKMRINARKYPVRSARGNARKYSAKPRR